MSEQPLYKMDTKEKIVMSHHIRETGPDFGNILGLEKTNIHLMWLFDAIKSPVAYVCVLNGVVTATGFTPWVNQGRTHRR